MIKTKTKTCVGKTEDITSETELQMWPSYNMLRCGGENMAARVMAYCLPCMEAVAREEER